MGEQRIELLEKYCSNSEEEIEQFDLLGIPLKTTYGFRRIYPLVRDIYPREIEGNNEETIIVFKHLPEGVEGREVIVLGNYDELCIELNDIENSTLENEGI